MKKLKLQVQLSVDGFVGGPKGELDWMVWDWDDELKDFVTALTEAVDCIILGNKMAPGFIPYWEGVAANPVDPQHEFGKKMTDTKKVVFTKTLQKSPWNNTKLATGDLVEEINTLKAKSGSGDIIVYGGATFVSALIKAGLIDELNLFINPVAIGKGLTIFKELVDKQKFSLANSKAFACGIVVLTYNLKKD